jgi:hypothetical protein
MIETGEDIEKTLVTVRLDDMRRHAKELLREPSAVR